MKKYFKFFMILVVLMILIYVLFVIEESIRMSNNLDAKPLFVLNEEYSYEKITYTSIGFSLTNKYGYVQLEYENNERIIIGQDLVLFNIFIIWGWIS